MGTIAELLLFVTNWAPQLANDATALSNLYGAASDAVHSAAPDGTIAAGDWDTLNATVAHLRADLDAEVAADAASTVRGAA